MKIHGSNTVAAAGARVAMTAYGLELRNARIPAGLRQEDVAVDLGVSTQTVRNWESGRVEPSEGEQATAWRVIRRAGGRFRSVLRRFALPTSETEGANRQREIVASGASGKQVSRKPRRPRGSA